MPDLSKTQVEHIAKLARLRLSPEELEKMSKELSSILKWVDMLGEVDTKNVAPTAQVTGLTNALRDDVVTSGAVSPDDLLKCSPLPVTDHQISTPHAHG